MDSGAVPVLYRWPAAAKFGRAVPKAKFYEKSNVPTALRERFIADVRRITWAYKLADETIRLRGTEAVPEIQVFVVDAKEDVVADDVLAAIDRAVPFPIIFELGRGAEGSAEVCMVAGHKQLRPGTVRIGSYFATQWQPADAPRSPLPPALDLPGLYSALISPLLPDPARPGESMSEATGRMELARKLEREIAALQKRLRAEPQLNRKVELRRALRTKQAELEQQR
ncbi:DUF4391 domain-containing protein [Microbacteriaceae bacterium 4G12]